MKLHNLSVIFIVIAIPLILITAYYISLQIDTINMQTSYNTKLLDSTKEAIDAFEINTVEWNANYSETADSKRRDVMASINTFINSFANNLGVGGTSKEYIMAYMPAIAYTLYDGYYIYSPANEKVALKDDNGVGIVMTKELTLKKDESNNNIIEDYSYNEKDEGKLLYVPKNESDKDGTYNGTAFTLDSSKAAEEYDHILKPFALYSERIGNYVINYTLDNYITIYGNVEDDEFVYKAGYLTNLKKFNNSITADTVEGITFNGSTMEPEHLSEKIAYKYTYEDANGKNVESMKTGTYYYVYESEGNTKVYFDGDNDYKPFIIDSNSNKIDLDDNNMDKYKKVTIPQQKSGQWTYKEVYQNLRTGDWYDKNKTKIENIGCGIDSDIKLDYSAINYCVESYIITRFVNSLRSNLKTASECECGYNCGTEPLYISSENDPEDPDSAFCMHKRGIIKNAIESNLNQAITSYSRNSAGEYKLPKLTETDWDQILENVSIITFIQNIPIGLKYYNNYAIATSTVNKEYVDPDEIYLNAIGDTYYHMPYCTHLTKTENLIGYRSIDYVQRSYTIKENAEAETKTKYYYKHTDNPDGINIEQACYYCLVQRSLYKESKTSEKETAYNTALARERYVARMSRLPAEVQASYYIHVYPYYIEEGGEKIVGNASYKITEEKETGDTTTINQTGNTTTKISKDSKKYTINSFGIENSENPIFDASNAIIEYGEIDNPQKTETTFEEFSVYKVKGQGEVKVNIINYSYSSGLDFRVDPINFEKWGAGDSSDNFEDDSIEHFSTENDGYINFKVEYEKTYKDSNSGAGITAFANINRENDLTIATNTGSITGLVRLKFTNTDSSGNSKTYYSKDIFNIENVNTTIYCRIENDDYCWYNNDWKVEVLDIAGNTIKSTDKMEYYTINDALGLKCFANATNGGAKTSDRQFYLINDLDEVGDMDPIAVNNKGNRLYFDGFFSGKYDIGKTDNGDGLVEKVGDPHKITGVTISGSATGHDVSYGLFGWVGSPAIIEYLIIDNIQVGYTSNGHDIKTGRTSWLCRCRGLYNKYNCKKCHCKRYNICRRNSRSKQEKHNKLQS